MIDRFKLFNALHQIKKDLFFDTENERVLAQKIWQKISHDSTFRDQIHKTQTSVLVPLWNNDLADVKQVKMASFNYQLLAVDGSQIYPDRHEGTSCSLINIGGIWLNYKDCESEVAFFSEPSIYFAQYREDHEISVESIDAHRHELELKMALAKALQYKKNAGFAPVVLFDGALIFWHLVDKPRMKKYYLKRYCALLDQFYRNRILIACYISLPKSKELINLVRLYLKDYCSDQQEIQYLVDADLAALFLNKFERTIIFENKASIVHEYPEQMRPFFFYINVGEEIARVELPRWIIDDEQSLEFVERVIVDQVIKGDGYPLSLAEAHEQAVVKSADRTFFYRLLATLNNRHGNHLSLSRKYMKKKCMRV